ncbi:MAG: lipid II:glycine glycyltransferase FemX [Limnohabitans sp.]
MKVSWNELPRKAWVEFHAQHGGSMQQSWAYGAAMQAMGVTVHRAAVRDGSKLVALAQFVCRRLALYIGLASCSRGPVWHPSLEGPVRAQLQRQFKQDIPTRWWRATLLTPAVAMQDLLPGEMQGLQRVMTGYSTVMLDLRQNLADLRLALDGKWRNRLVKSESGVMQVRVDADRQLCRQLLERERWQRADRNFYGLPTAFVDAYLDAHEPAAQGYLVASASAPASETPMASMLFLRHGCKASYYIGWADEEGRKSNAHNRLLWEALNTMKQSGITDLDLGGINTHDLPGISRFKLGTGGRVLTLAGTYF